jgi:carbon-monoxide dehydrogenase small subunit
MILATHHLLDKYPRPTLEQIREGLAGNLCRCTGYMRIFEAVERAAEHGTDGVTQ